MVVSIYLVVHQIITDGRIIFGRHTRSNTFPLPLSEIHKLQKTYKDFPNITTIVRTTSKPPLLYQFYCMFLRTTLLFWPALYGNVVIVLDEEHENDHAFGETLLHQFREHYPEYGLNVYYEPLPKDIRILQDRPKSESYNRQMWSTFFADCYTNDSMISYMDTDV